MNIMFAYLSFAIIIGVTIPYMYDVVHGRARPARAARLMFFVLLIITLLQQADLSSGYAMAVTIGEFISSAFLLALAIRYGVGGFSRVDKICYLLLAIDLIIWVLTKNTLVALHLTMLADTISFWPTLEKTWREPWSETPLFFWGGVVAPIFSLLAQGSWGYSIIVFPLYLSAVNFLEVILIHAGRLSRPLKLTEQK